MLLTIWAVRRCRLKFFRSSWKACYVVSQHRKAAGPAALVAVSLWGLSVVAWQAHADWPRWMQDAVHGSAIEAALYRVMELPGVRTPYPRPPKEAEKEFGGLIGKSSKDAELYSLRAMEEEQSLDFK